ncbi:protein FAM8A1b isoform X2 [Electrophorus electricus]|uniref:protein FAM8A1b isoform X2 n=1 Tax=Electrophorus electricus TaxID=8005 RepID=UPI0015D043A9|nr:protein FAM8A1b isoform X2 [Electrophorus electricus]
MADSEGRVHELPKTLSGAPGTARDMSPVTKHRPRSARGVPSTKEYCEKLQEWMWQYYCGYANWQSWGSFLPGFAAPGAPTRGLEWTNADPRGWVERSWGFAAPSVPAPATTSPSSARPREVPDIPPAQFTQQQHGNTQPPGREYSVPSPFQRFLAEMLDFFLLFFIKAAVILSIMYMSGMKDLSKFALHFVVEEMDEDTSMEELRKMMLVALVYRILIVCIWGAGGATPGKFLIGLRVVTCDTAVLTQPNRVRVVPATNVSLSASAVRALNKNFSIAFFFPAFITLLFFQHNRTVYDIVAGTIVVKRNRLR